MPSSIAAAGYELSQSAIDEQNERLGELRGRTATLLATASLAASFLGGQSIRAAGTRSPASPWVPRSCCGS